MEASASEDWSSRYAATEVLRYTWWALTGEGCSKAKRWLGTYKDRGTHYTPGQPRKCLPSPLQRLLYMKCEHETPITQGQGDDQ